MTRGHDGGGCSCGDPIGEPLPSPAFGSGRDPRRRASNNPNILLSGVSGANAPPRTPPPTSLRFGHLPQNLRFRERSTPQRVVAKSVSPPIITWGGQPARPGRVLHQGSENAYS